MPGRRADLPHLSLRRAALGVPVAGLDLLHVRRRLQRRRADPQRRADARQRPANEDVNEEWTCDRGKFEQYWVNSTDRVKEPHVRAGLAAAPRDLGRRAARAPPRAPKDAAAADPNSVAGIGSTRASNEDLYLFQRLFRGALGTNNLDHRMFPFPILPMQTSIAEVGEAKQIVAVGTQVDDDLPVLWLRVYKAISKGGAKYFRNDDARSADSRRGHRRRAGDRRPGLVRAARRPTLSSCNAACAASGREAERAAAGQQFLGRDQDGRPAGPPARAAGASATARRPKFEALWGGPLPAEPGLDTRGILEGCVSRHDQGAVCHGQRPGHDASRTAIWPGARWKKCRSWSCRTCS